MIPLKAVLIAAPLALASAGVAVHANGRVASLRREVAEAGRAQREARDAYVTTLRSGDVERQLAAFDRERELTVDLARARRDRVLGVLGVLGAAIVAAGVTFAQRVAREIEDGSEDLASAEGRRPPGAS